MAIDDQRFIQWFNAVQDLNPAFLTPQDGLLAINLLRKLGQRVPDSVWQLAFPKGVPEIIRSRAVEFQGGSAGNAGVRTPDGAKHG